MRKKKAKQNTNGKKKINNAPSFEQANTHPAMFLEENMCGNEGTFSILMINWEFIVKHDLNFHQDCMWG